MLQILPFTQEVETLCSIPGHLRAPDGISKDLMHLVIEDAALTGILGFWWRALKVISFPAMRFMCQQGHSFQAAVGFYFRVDWASGGSDDMDKEEGPGVSQSKSLAMSR